MSEIAARIQRWAWIQSYELEERRQQAAACGKVWQEARACIALGFIRLVEVRQ